MNDSIFYIVGAILVVSGLAIHFGIIWRRHQKDYRNYLEPILKPYGLRYLDSSWPGFFQVGPFPKFEMEFGRPQSRIGGIRGEYNEYRIVKMKDSTGQMYTMWALLEFEVFRIRRIRWRVSENNDVPEAVKSLLEN